MEEGLVSIIMPSYNTQKYISTAIDSVLNQTYTNWELIIVDDGSVDESVEVISRFKDERIFFIALPQNKGPKHVRNLALERANGKFIAFLDSDDLWHSDKLERQIAFMQQNNSVLSYTPYAVIDEEGKEIGGFYPRNKINYFQMLQTCDIGNSTAIYDVKSLGKVQSGDLRHDYELWLKILKQNHQGLCYPPPPTTQNKQSVFLASIRIRRGSDTYNKAKSAKLQWRVYREVEKLSLLRSVFFFGCYAYYGVKKRFAYFGIETK